MAAKKPRPPITPPDPEPIAELRQYRHGADTFHGEGGATFHGIGTENFLIIYAATSETARRLVLRKMLQDSARAQFRVSRTTWVVLTERSAREWYSRLRPLFPSPARLIVAPVEIDQLEAVYPEFREWLSRYFGRSEDVE